MTKVLTWNVGCFNPVDKLKTYKGHAVKKQQFQQFNGDFVSNTIRQINPDILFLQEITETDDLEHIDALKDYPYHHLSHNTHHSHHILTASKTPFNAEKHGSFTLVRAKHVSFIPVHLSTYHSTQRLKDAKALVAVVKGTENIAIMGDTNMWSRGSVYPFRADREAYRVLTAELTDLTRGFRSTTRFFAGLDKVFVSKNFVHSTASLLKVHGTFIDHYPLIVELEQ